ncbi:MAG: helix-turn-helix transcriptional regulator [Phycisphaeraceae bacterium]|nr:helix-turn-helix transcriptional regulator [Phycisphaeraceae bacterium]
MKILPKHHAGTEAITGTQLRERLGDLTRRESEVLEYLLQGLSNEEIALKLCRSAKTIDKHCQSIYRKSGIHKRANLVRSVLDLNRPSPDPRPAPPTNTAEAINAVLRQSRAWEKLTQFESALSRSSGVEYFGDLCKALAGIFGVRMAGISEVHRDSDHGDIIACCVEGELIMPFRYPIENSACGLTYQEGKVECLKDLAMVFGKEPCELVVMGYDSYVGVRLDDRFFGPIGTLWIADFEPMSPDDMHLAILRIFAPAVTSELATQIALDRQR